MRDQSDRRSTQREPTRAGRLRSHLERGDHTLGRVRAGLVDARAKPARASRGRLRRPLSALVVRGSVDMSRSGREPAEDLLVV